MRRILCFCLIFAAALTACSPGTEKAQEEAAAKEPGMYFLDHFTSWENLETSGSLWVEDGILKADVSYEEGACSQPDRVGGTIVLPDGVTTIDKYTFSGCSNIEKIIIPETVQCIEQHAFRGCEQLQGLKLPNSVSQIGESAFSNCGKITELEIPDGVTRIGKGAFDGVENITYHGNLTYTPDDVYWGAGSLNHEKKGDEETFETEVDGVRYTYKKFDRQENAVVITKIENAGRNLVIPAKLDGFDVYCVGSGNIVIFGYDKNVKKGKLGDDSVPVLDSITIEDGIKGIGSSAFNWILSKRLSLPPSLEFINYAAFEYNVYLKKVVIKSRHVDIGTRAFAGCRLLRKCKWKTGIYTGNIGEEAFEGSGIRELQLPVMEDMNNQMGGMAFHSNTYLKKVTFAKGTFEVGISEECFGDCPDARIIIGKGVKTFSSDKNTNSGKVRLLDKNTEIVFSKIVKAKEGAEQGCYVDVEDPKGEEFRYRTSYREFTVPKGFPQTDILKKAYYVEYENEEELSGKDEKKEYYKNPGVLLKKVQYHEARVNK